MSQLSCALIHSLSAHFKNTSAIHLTHLQDTEASGAVRLRTAERCVPFQNQGKNIRCCTRFFHHSRWAANESVWSHRCPSLVESSSEAGPVKAVRLLVTEDELQYTRCANPPCVHVMRRWCQNCLVTKEDCERTREKSPLFWKKLRYIYERDVAHQCVSHTEMLNSKN